MVGASDRGSVRLLRVRFLSATRLNFRTVLLRSYYGAGVALSVSNLGRSVGSTWWGALPCFPLFPPYPRCAMADYSSLLLIPVFAVVYLVMVYALLLLAKRGSRRPGV